METPLVLVIIVGCVIAVGNSPVEATDPYRCNTGWHYFDGNCYLFWTKTLSDRSFDGQQKNCQSKGGNLASIHSQAQNQFIYGKIRAIGGWFWLGLEDKNGDKILQWVDGSPADYLSWANSNLPSDRRLCMNMQSNSDKWRVSQLCTANAPGGVCMKPASKLPCEAAKCLNGGNCLPSGAGYTCTCEKGFTGKHCETDTDDCPKADCGRQKCVDGPDSHKCE